MILIPLKTLWPINDPSKEQSNNG
uniref:Uncharacterized protein n=1 Tax=Rhizophora mucronata TaxID=61149 RepID=A0A2P2PBN2_RHIMU